MYLGGLHKILQCEKQYAETFEKPWKEKKQSLKHYIETIGTESFIAMEFLELIFKGKAKLCIDSNRMFYGL